MSVATLAPPVETIEVDVATVACNGDGGALGHPTVYLNVADNHGAVECPYCSRRYVLKAGAKVGHH